MLRMRTSLQLASKFLYSLVPTAASSIRIRGSLGTLGHRAVVYVISVRPPKTYNHVLTAIGRLNSGSANQRALRFNDLRHAETVMLYVLPHFDGMNGQKPTGSTLLPSTLTCL